MVRPGAEIAKNGCVKTFVFSNASQHSTFARRFFLRFHRIVIPWARIRVLLVPCWMMRVVAFVSQLVMYIFCIVSEDCCLLPVPGVFIYGPLNSNEFYPPPQQNDSGDQTCDCNSVMYKYEVQTSRGGSCADFHFAISLIMACASCQGSRVYS